MEFDEEAFNNGLILNSYFIPEEIVIYILNFVDANTLVHRCRFVCRLWRDIISDDEVWKLKMIRSNVASLSKFSTSQRKQLTENFPWYMYYWTLLDVPFEQNLLQNNCGQFKLKHWTVTNNADVHGAGDHPLGSRYWDIEKIPVSSDPLPESDDFGKSKSCFSTSYVTCTKHQIIDLRKAGFPSKVLDSFQPPITISEWYTGRFDCGCRYVLRIYLLDSDQQIILQAEPIVRTRTQWEGTEWNKVTLILENYGPGVRYVKFEHEGKDTQFWAGNYGSKMAGGVVKISFPRISPSVE